MQKINHTLIYFNILYNDTHAQEIKKISLQEAFDLASQNSKQLQLDSLKIQALDIKRKQTQNAMLPVVGINASYTRLSNNIEPFQIPFNGTNFTLNPQILNQYNNRVYPYNNQFFKV
jgi:outer membrane protein